MTLDRFSFYLIYEYLITGENSFLSDLCYYCFINVANTDYLVQCLFSFLLSSSKYSSNEKSKYFPISLGDYSSTLLASRIYISFFNDYLKGYSLHNRFSNYLLVSSSSSSPRMSYLGKTQWLSTNPFNIGIKYSSISNW